MITPDLQLAIQRTAAQVLNSIPEGLAITGTAWLLLSIGARNNSANRFILWFLSLLAVAALPLIPHPTHRLDEPLVESGLILPARWGIALVAIWSLFAGRAILRVVSGLRNLQRLRDNSVPLQETEIDPSVRKAIEDIRAIRSIEVRRSDGVTVPTAVGFFRPMILLPHWALEELASGELKAILFHEFAHLRRWDDWTNLAQKLVRTVFFFHPAVWWIERRLSLEREIACDDFVVRKTGNSRAYAEFLVTLAERSVLRRGLTLAQAVIGSARDTAHRLTRILDPDRVSGNNSVKPAFAMALALAVTSGVGIFYRPEIVTFDSALPVPSLARTLKPPTLMSAAAPPQTQSHVILAGIKQLHKTATPSSAEHPASLRGPVHAMTVNAAAIQPNVTETPQFVVVMQSTHYDGQNLVQRFCVWKITIEHDDGRIIREELIVRSL